MKKIFKSITFEWSAMVLWARYKLACRKAMKFHRIDGKQYHVIPKGSLHFVVFCNSNKEAFIKLGKKLGRKNISYQHLLKEALFHTPVGKRNVGK